MIPVAMSFLNRYQLRVINILFSLHKDYDDCFVDMMGTIQCLFNISSRNRKILRNVVVTLGPKACQRSLKVYASEVMVARSYIERAKTTIGKKCFNILILFQI